MAEENIENIRRDATSEIKKKAKKNPKYLHPCNKERKNDESTLGFSSGHEYTGWLQQNGIMKNPTNVDISAKKHRNENVEFVGNFTNIELLDEKSAKIKTHLPPNQKCYKCDNDAYRRERDINGEWTGKYVCKSHYDKCFYRHNRNPNSKTYIEIPENEICHICNNKIAERGQIDNQGNWTGIYVCMNCYWNGRYHNNRDKILAEKSQWRKGELDPEGTKGRSFIYEQIVCITLEIDNLNIKNNNWNSPTDGDKHEKYGYLSIKGSVLEYCGDWGFADTNKGKFDTLMLVCMNKDSSNVSRMYAIPEEEAIKRTGIRISVESKSWIDKYRIDEKPFDTIYQNIKLEDFDVFKNRVFA